MRSHPMADHPDIPVVHQSSGQTFQPPAKDSRPESRGLPSGGVTHKSTSDKQKLALIREALGEDPQVAKLRAENAKLQSKVDDLQAQLDLVAQVLHLDGAPKKK